MISLYFHLPFCSQVCSYCSFSIVANQPSHIFQAYLAKLHEEIDYYGTLYPKAEIKSIYFGGGTPNLVGAEELKKLIDHCGQVFNCEMVAELSVECNPYPQEEILSFVRLLNLWYKKRPRIRFSFGLQSFDNAVLAAVGRPCSFPGMVDFLRSLQPLKQENNVFNFDFIAFGAFNKTKKGEQQLRTPSAFSFFQDFVDSHFADSLSLYTLEFSEHQKRNRARKADLLVRGCFGTEEEISDEFDLLKSVVLEGGYSRYEISNFSLVAKSSIHNRVYWEMETYVGLGLGASSLGKFPIGKESQKDGTRELRRYSNTPYLPKYLEGETVVNDTLHLLTEADYLIEKFFLGLRTERGIQHLSAFSSVLIPCREEKVKQYEEGGLLRRTTSSLFNGMSSNKEETFGLVLTDRGMDCYNWIITELLQHL